MKYKLIRTGAASAEEIMNTDAALLDHLNEGSPVTIHFYQWRAPSATYGYFLDPHKVLLSQHHLEIARRPTGGGLLFHVTDLAFSVLIPRHHPWLQHGKGTLENYHVINKKITSAIHLIFPNDYIFLEKSDPIDHPYCMAKGTKYDVLVGDKKIVGAAQRQKKQGILHQGTISLAMPDPDFLSPFLPAEVIHRMMQLTYAPLGFQYERLNEVRTEIEYCIEKVIKEDPDV